MAQEMKDKVGKRFICYLCDKSYARKMGIKFHMENIHLNEALSRNPDSRKCRWCTKFVLNENYQEHVRQKHKKLPCKICKRVYFRAKSFYCHMKTHETLKYSCDICKRKSITKKALETHILTLHVRPEPRSECEQCGKMIATRSLQKHINQVHKKHREFKCAVCKKGFYNKTMLRQHLDTVHLGEKNYKCPVEKCQRALTQASSLKQHLIRHEKRPFSCQECRKMFESEKARDNHRVKSHDNPKVMQACDRCNKKYTTRHRLRAHVRTQHLKLKFQCDACGNEYSYKDTLKQHLFKKHVENS